MTPPPIDRAPLWLLSISILLGAFHSPEAPLAETIWKEAKRFPTRTVKRKPKPDGTYIEFRVANGEALAISVPAGETRVLKYFQERMPYGLFVPDVP